MVKTLEKTFAIIDALDEVGPSRTVELADQLELPRSTIHHHLQVLQSHGYVENVDGTYRLTLQFMEVGERIRRRIELFTAGRSEVNELADRIGHPVGLFMKENESVVLLYHAGSNPMIPISPYPGQQFPLHATAPGKVLLAASIDEIDASALATLSLEGYTERTITDPDMLAANLREVAERGYGVARDERWEGRHGIAVPVPTSRSRSAALEAAIPSEEFDESNLEELSTELQHTASVIDIKSDYSQ